MLPMLAALLVCFGVLKLWDLAVHFVNGAV